MGFMGMAPRFGCYTAHYYYCSNATEVVNAAAAHGHTAGLQLWLEQMTSNFDLESGRGDNAGRGFSTLLRERSAALGDFARQRAFRGLTPPPADAPVLYPLGGLDVLTAVHLFPAASYACHGIPTGASCRMLCCLLLEAQPGRRAAAR